MAQNKKTEAIHPLGEGDFSFATPGGRVRMSVTKGKRLAGGLGLRY